MTEKPLFIDWDEIYQVMMDCDWIVEKRFPTILNHVIFVDNNKKPSIEEVKEQLMNQEPLISDEEAFERHLIRKWVND